MVERVNPLTTNRPINEENRTQSQEMRDWSNTVTDLLPIIGTGSPEGVVEARQGASYMDDAGTTGNIKYSKRDVDIAGDRTKGWILE